MLKRPAQLTIKSLKSCDEVFPDELMAHAMFAVLQNFIEDVMNPLKKDGSIYEHFEEGIVSEAYSLSEWWDTHLLERKKYHEEYSRVKNMKDKITADFPMDIKTNNELAALVSEKLKDFTNYSVEWDKKRKEKMLQLVELNEHLWF